MGLYEKIDSDMKSALKGGDALRLSVLRMVIAAVRMIEIEKNVKNADEADVIRTIQKQVKQHQDSIEQFNKGGRSDLAKKESDELAILESYLPKQLSDDELSGIVRSAISESGASTKQEVGKVMKLVMAKVQGRADGKRINQIALGILK